jgi:hypothetical protein
MRVCKQWYNASRKPLFWAERIKEKKRQYLNSKRIFLHIKEKRAAVDTFDTFGSIVSETFRDQLEWLFRKGWFDLSYGDDVIKHEDCTFQSHINVTRRTNHNTCYEERTFYDGQLAAKVWFQTGDIGFDINGRFIGDYMWQYGIKHLETTSSEKKANILRYNFENGDIFEGQGIRSSAEVDGRIWYLPHGDGVWKFADGTTLAGEMVACKGAPRYPDRPEKRIKFRND